MGILLILLIFFALLMGAGGNMEWSLAYLLVVLYLLWLGVRGKYHYILGIVTTGAIVLGYFLSSDPAGRSLTTFSSSFIAIFAVWIVIWFTYRQKQFLERKLKDKDRLDAMFENATEGMLMVSQSGNIIMLNKYAEKLFGYSREELIGEKIEKLIPARFASRHTQHRQGFNQDPRNRPMGIDMELYALRKDGREFPVEISLGHFKTNGEVIVIAFVIDITERKRASEQLKKEQERIQQLNQELELRVAERTRDLEDALGKLKDNNENLKQMEVDLVKALEKERELGELKSRFVSMASHEFRTPLSTILSSVFLLENYTGEQYEKSKMTHVKRIKRSVDNMTAILNDFLSLSRLEEGKIKASYADTDIPACIGEILEEMEPVKKQGQTLRYTHTGTANMLHTDKQFLRNVLINLISNAIKFSGTGDQIEITSRLDAQQLTLQVADRGIGIPEKEQKHIFNRFFRADNVTHIEGTGLGLNIVKRYVDLLKGRVSFESRPGNGTTFTVTIPPCDESRQAGSEELSDT